ncbi:MAG TPA: peptidylprolyl isomerase [bacterium]|nr:peptidylprolyl isomerase [bacterium]
MSAEQEEPAVKVSRAQVQGAVDAALAEDPSLRDHLDTLKAQMHQGAVAQSLFVAEAFSQGLAANDYIVRNRLVELQAMALYEKADALVTPEAVKLYFEKNRERYRSLPRRQCLQIFVPVTNLVGDTAARARLESIFNEGRDRLEPAGVTQDGLQKLYGPTMAATIFKLPKGEWSAAMRSGVGWHYVKVLQEDPGRLLDLDEARNQATEDYRRELRNQAYQEELSRLRARYQVEEEE